MLSAVSIYALHIDQLILNRSYQVIVYFNCLQSKVNQFELLANKFSIRLLFLDFGLRSYILQLFTGRLRLGEGMG